MKWDYFIDGIVDSPLNVQSWEMRAHSCRSEMRDFPLVRPALLLLSSPNREAPENRLSGAVPATLQQRTIFPQKAPAAHTLGMFGIEPFNKLNGNKNVVNQNCSVPKTLLHLSEDKLGAGLGVSEAVKKDPAHMLEADTAATTLAHVEVDRPAMPTDCKVENSAVAPTDD